MVYGRSVLTHPLMVEAIETFFVPVAIYNNVKGKDAEVLARYEEPSWNNPVTRFVDAAGKDLIPRKDRVWTMSAMGKRMVAALEKADVDVPLWFRDHVRGAQPVRAGVRPAPPVKTPKVDATAVGRLPLTVRQAVRLEAALADGKPTSDLLSPRQRALLTRIDAALKKGKLETVERPRDGKGLAAYQKKLVAALAEAGV